MKSIVFFLTSLLILLSLISYAPQDIAFLAQGPSEATSNLIGVGGAYLGFFLFFLVGYAAYFLPFFLFISGLGRLGILRSFGLAKGRVINTLAFLLFIVFLSGFIGLCRSTLPDTELWKAGGFTGFFLSRFFKTYLGVSGAFITFFLLMLVNAVLFCGFFFVDTLRWLKIFLGKLPGLIRSFKKRKPAEVSDVFKPKIQEAAKPPEDRLKRIKPEIKVYTPKVETSPKREPADFETLSGRSRPDKEQAKKKIENLENKTVKTFDPRTYKLPQPTLLKVPPFPDQRETKEDIKVNIKNLESTLSDFGVEAKVVSVQKGPVVTMYELQPQSGTKINKISALADDIALAMKSSSVRVVAPLPGRGTVGVEIPNIKKHFVFLREVLEEKAFINSSSKLTLVIGKNVSGNPVVADLNDMPHLLIAGATGAGKTVCVNSLISSILFKARPDEVKFIMVDPKMVELAAFSGIPHLIHPLISEAKKAFFALSWAVEEMEKRYKVLAEAGCRNIDFYNKNHQTAKMPYIIIVVDELADLMVVARENIETAIQRLAQLSRAVGIHLILATQRPSVDVITGVIKANFPARISFKVSSKVDSRTVLDIMGADKLLGKGDLLFLKPGAAKLIRAQGSYIDDEDIESLTNFIRAQGGPVYEKAIAEGEKKHSLDMGSDELFDEAVKIILLTRQASASILQRRLRVGYTRAARLLDLMEQAGIVGPFCGSKAREILVDSQSFLAEKGLK